MFAQVAAAASRLTASAKVAAFMAAADITKEEELALDDLLSTARPLPFLKSIPANLYPSSARALACMLVGQVGVLSRAGSWVATAMRNDVALSILVPTLSEVVAHVAGREHIVTGLAKMLNLAGASITPGDHPTFDDYLRDGVFPSLAELLSSGQETHAFVSCNACGALQVYDPSNPNECRMCGTKH